jgi:acetylornithine/succinyldiaminopimelate/putrescine aminotransferase
MTNWQELDKKYIINYVNRIPLTLVRGEGVRVWDDNDQEYLDFVAGTAVNSLGHCHPVVVEAVTEQARTLIQASALYYSIPQTRLAQLLVENSCLDKAFICNSGTEAGEGVVKLARRYGHLKLNGAYEVITAKNSFHGRTLMMTAATGQESMHKPYTPLPNSFRHVDFNDIEAIKAATTERTCAVMRTWCDEKGILLILDEIQTGIGRIGSLFGYQEYGIEPDIISLAKGMGSGIPIGAFLAKESAAVFVPGDHGSTFGGNPLTCAAAYAVIKYIIENDIAGNAKKVGQYLIEGLKELQKKHTFITDVRGRGLLVAIGFDREIGQEVMMACLERGLLVNRVKPNTLRFIPPLIIGNNEVDEALGILDKALSPFDK